MVDALGKIFSVTDRLSVRRLWTALFKGLAVKDRPPLGIVPEICGVLPRASIVDGIVTLSSPFDRRLHLKKMERDLVSLLESCARPVPAGSRCLRLKRWPTVCSSYRRTQTVSQWVAWWARRGAPGLLPTTWLNCARGGTAMPSPDKPLRILTITHNYPRFAGDPAGAFVARVAEGAVARGHQVEVIAPHSPGTATDEPGAGVRLRRFRYAPERFERVAYTGGLHQGTLRSPLAALAFPGFLWAFSQAVRGAVRRFDPDLIHAHWWFPSGWLASRREVPYLITCHGSDVRLLDRGALVRRAGQGVFQKASRITAVSNFLADDLVRLLTGEIIHCPLDTVTHVSGRLRIRPRRAIRLRSLGKLQRL
jgi:hypothetical protein